MDLIRSPLAPKKFPTLPVIEGVLISTARSGLKYKGRPDLLLVSLKPSTSIAGVFTKSSAPGNPVVWCKKQIGQGRARGLIINSGNANVFTGKNGLVAVKETAKSVAKILKCPKNQIFVASTGVIGETLDYSKIITKIEPMSKRLLATSWKQAAIAITTTDTFPKGSTRSTKIGNKTIQITGIAKGSGMIAPDMATMLGFIFTDASIPATILQTILKRNVRTTFNSITVDSDTSTSDTVLLCATGATKSSSPTSANDPLLKAFESALNEVMLDLAKQIVRDGEGAQKLIRIDVEGAISKQSARQIGLSIANSPLVKTAVAGGDANWGRIVMAVGKSAETADRDKMSVSFGGIKIAENGSVVENYDETPVAKHLLSREIHIHVDVGVGSSNNTVWTCDLTHGYIDINADYRS